MLSSSSSEYFATEYSKALTTDTAAVFVGAGLSMAAGYPGWADLVLDIAEILDIPRSDDLVTLAQFSVNQDRNRILVNRRIVEEFGRNRKPTEIHRQLVRLPITTFWTTNYDDLLEQSLIDAGRIPDVKRCQSDLAVLIPDRAATVFKMHGDARSPQDTVLIRDDYEEYSKTRELFVDTLTADLLMKTFVFIGVSFTDPNVNFLLGRLRSICNGAKKGHFWIVKKPESADPALRWFRYRVEDLSRYGISTVVIEEHDQLGLVLAQLREKYRNLKRRRAVFISGALDDDDPKAEEVRHFAQLLTRKLLGNGITVITGLGHGLGSYVTTTALDLIYQAEGHTVRPDQLVARPFPVGFGHDANLRTTHRERMIGEAGFAVFISGHEERPSGVREEYEIAKRLGCCTIPIGASGRTAAELWNECYARGEYSIPVRGVSLENLFLRISPKKSLDETAVDAVQEIVSLVRS